MTTLPHHRCGRACWGMLHLWLSRRRGLLYAGPPEAWNVLYTPREAVRCMLVLFIVVCISSPPFSLPHAPCIKPLLTSPPHIDSPFLPPPTPPPQKKMLYICRQFKMDCKLEHLDSSSWNLDQLVHRLPGDSLRQPRLAALGCLAPRLPPAVQRSLLQQAGYRQLRSVSAIQCLRDAFVGGYELWMTS